MFADFDYGQKDKAYAAHNAEFTELTWFYVFRSQTLLLMVGTVRTIGTLHITIGEGVWYYGSLARTAFMDRGVYQYPIAAQGGYLYNHESWI